jgi:MFS family permease
MFSRNARLFLASTILSGINFGIWGAIFNLYLRELGYREDFAGFMFSLNALATGFMALPAGLLCEGIGRKRSLLLGTLVSNLFYLVQVFTGEPSLLLATSLAAGLVGTISWVAYSPFMMENSEKEERTYLFSMSWAFMTVAGMVGSLLGGYLPDSFAVMFEGQMVLGFRLTLLCSIAFTFVSLLPILLIKEKRTSKQTATQLLFLKNIQSGPTILKLVLTTGLIGFGAGFIVPLFNMFFANKLHATTEQIGVIFALGQVALAIGTFLAPVLSSRMGKVKAVVLCQVCSIPFISMIALSETLELAGFSYLVRGALMNMAGPIGSTFAMELVQSTERATTSGLTVMTDMLPRAIGAKLGGQMMESGEYVLPYFYTSIFYMIAATLYFGFFRKREKK